ncbi:MAG: hypothetical protein ACI9TH_004936 [Kiritimatiellia bacterium]|jgi:hypothetical protein
MSQRKRDQTMLNTTIWIYIASIVAGLFLPANFSNALLVVWAIVIPCGAFFTARLAYGQSSRVWTVIATLCALIPLLGLIPLFLVNGRARDLLAHEGADSDQQ